MIIVLSQLANRQFCKVQVVGAVDVGYVGRKLRKVRNNLCLKPIWQSPSHLPGVQSHPALSHRMRTELGFFFSVNMLVWACVSHSSYLSQPPQPAVVYFFLAGVLFRIMNAKFWPILSHCDQVRIYFRKYKHFLVYFLQAHIMWWCIKIDKYGVCNTGATSLDHKI